MNANHHSRATFSRFAGFILLIIVPIGYSQSTMQATAPTPPAVAVSRVDETKYVVEENIPYGSHSQQVLDMLQPKDRAGRAKLPGVIMFHGGGWIETNKSTMSSFYNRFLAHGFVVCNVEYRMASMDGAGNYTANSALAPAAVQDALIATKWFWDHADQYNVDKSRFIVTGASAGGHLALMVGLCTPSADLGPTSPADFKIAAIVNGYGPADMVEVLHRTDAAPKQWVPESLPNRDKLIKRINPMTYVRKDIPPLLTVIGSNDHGLAGNQHMIESLKVAGADADLHVVPGAGHGFTSTPGAWPDAEAAMFSFLANKGIIDAQKSSTAP